MHVSTETISLSTEGFCHLVDITAITQDKVRQSGLTQGIAVVFVPGSTGGVLTLEFEDGLVHDFEQLMERLVPQDVPYDHDRRWGDGNGFSHIRSALMGASAVVPVVGGRLALGTWQQLLFADFDNRRRQRTVIVQLLGE
ncbi:MAG: secondary thiamine-phosphate synthase enzyme [Dehalococcoidia bacterium SM23_28_2]|nr:MAG: secondary thiamine-phosphate synthase enzyme [Dehalococcoidia bacterium SM23_28_2]